MEWVNTNTTTVITSRETTSKTKKEAKESTTSMKAES